MEVNMYDMYQHICFEVRGKGLNPNRVNPVLEKFREKLLAYRFEEDGLKAFPDVVDEFIYNEVDTSLLRCSYQIKWRIVDNDAGKRTDRFNNEIKPKLRNEMQGFRLEKVEKYNRKISIEVVNSAFQGEVKRGAWPQEHMAIVMY